MKIIKSNPWIGTNDFLLKCGNNHETKSFCVSVINELYSLVPYDQARIYFIDDYGDICDEVLFGVDWRWSKLYREYYSNIKGYCYSIESRIKSHSYVDDKCEISDWRSTSKDDFIGDYIRPQRINYSLSFTLQSLNRVPRSVCILDRLSNKEFDNQEIQFLELVYPHLNNLHYNLYVNTQEEEPAKVPLTNRECEIVELLCKGCSPSNISSILSLSKHTVYKHISNIHTKLHVSTRQELLIKLMSFQKLEEAQFKPLNFETKAI